MTRTQRNALKWLKDHGGDGVFDKRGVLFARGEDAESNDGFFMRATWRALVEAGMCEYYGGKHGRGRLRVTELGNATT